MGASSSSAAPALLPDDVILEILLRVPPEPIYLLRASLVCWRWRGLIRDPAFVRRFRARRRHAAPLVGFFREDGRFVPTGEPASDRVAAAHFSRRLPLHDAGRWRVFDSRHGRVLLSAGRSSGEKLELLVWDPMTGRRTHISPPRHVPVGHLAANGLTYYERPDPLVRPPCARAALVCDHHDGDGGGGCCHSRPFRVVLMFPCSGTMFAAVYSSKTGEWGDVTRVLGRPCYSVSHWEPNSVLAGNVLYWPELHGTGLLGYDLGTNRFRHVEEFHPDDDPFDCVQVFRAAGGELRLAAAFRSSLYLFAPVATEDEDTMTWEEYRELDLDALLPPQAPAPMAMASSSSSPPPVKRAEAVGFDEEGNTIFLDMGDGVFSLQLESLKVNKVLETGVLRPYMDDSYLIPYMSFFVADNVDGAELAHTRADGDADHGAEAQVVGLARAHSHVMVERMLSLRCSCLACAELKESVRGICRRKLVGTLSSSCRLQVVNDDTTLWASGRSAWHGTHKATAAAGGLGIGGCG